MPHVGLRLRNRRRNLSLSDVITPQFLVLGLIWYIVFLFSTTCHEGGHSLAAYLGGDTTAFQGGQMSLNPLPHIRREPMGLVVVPILSYLIAHWMIGWASAPYNPSWQQRYPRRAAWMALAGPAANFVLVIASGHIRSGWASLFGFFRFPESVGFTHIVEAAVPWEPRAFAATFLSILFVLNLLLGTFNLLPVPPLDGNTGITLFMSERAALRFLQWTRSQGFGMAGLGCSLGWSTAKFSTSFFAPLSPLSTPARTGVSPPAIFGFTHRSGQSRFRIDPKARTRGQRRGYTRLRIAGQD